MATRGRKPKPAHLKLIDGNPGKRAIDPPPKTRPSKPTCPSWLPPAAKKAWRRIVPHLDDIGVLHKIDREKLTLLATVIGQFEDITRSIADTGYTVPNREGHPVRNPLLIEQRQLARLIASIGSDFGLDPVSRERLAVPEGLGDVDMEELLG